MIALDSNRIWDFSRTILLSRSHDDCQTASDFLVVAFAVASAAVAAVVVACLAVGQVVVLKLSFGYLDSQLVVEYLASEFQTFLLVVVLDLGDRQE